MATTHFTAWLVNISSYLDQPNMDLTVFEDTLLGGDSDDDASWSTDGSKGAAFYAITSVSAEGGDIDDGLGEARDLLEAAGWSVVGAWEPTDNAYTVTVEREAETVAA